MKRSVVRSPSGTSGIFCWHVHHDKLAEPLTGPLKNRISYIKREKPKNERALRLRLIKRVRGKLPVGLVKARAAYNKARAAYDKARSAYVKVWAAYNKAVQDNTPALRALHAKECPNCPWDGKTIFSVVQP